MKRTLSIAALGISVFALPSAFAADGYVTGNVNLRAGPDSSYPSVARLPAGTPVAIEGCVDGWSWCDVAVGNDRGWVAGNFLQDEYQGQRVMVPQYGVQIGIPVVSFIFGSYWDDHYRNRSWYGDRDHWSHMTPQYRSGTSHGDWHGGDMHGATQTHSHGTSADVHGSHQPVHQASVGVTSVTTRPPQHAAPAKPIVSQHTVATQKRPVDTSTVKPHVHNAVEPVAHATQPMAAHTAPQPRTVAEHKAVEPKATRKPTPEKNAAENKDDHGKDQH